MARIHSPVWHAPVSAPMHTAAGMPDRYTRTAIVLHWLIAVLLIGQFAFGLLLGDIARGTPARGMYVNLHKSSGIVIGLLILLRIVWRLTHAPPQPAAMPRWQRHAAMLSHALLYLCMAALPLSGYLASNFSKDGIQFFNVVQWPPWGPDDKSMYQLFNGIHHLAALLLAIFVVVHVLAVAKHMLVDRDGLLRRMWR